MNRTVHTTRQLVGLALLLALGLAGAGAAVAAEAPSGVVNLNTATAEQLALLPGIGPAVAGRIVEQRTSSKFRKAEELMLVRGVGEKTFEKLRPYVVTEGQTTLSEKVRLPRAKAEEKG